MFNTGIVNRLRAIADRARMRAETKRTTDIIMADRSDQSRPSSRADRLIAHVGLELENLQKRGHTPRLEYLLGILHLTYTYAEGPAESQRIQQRLAPLIASITKLGRNDENAPTESSAPLAYFLSYPRSGNTLTTRLSAIATQGQIFSGARGRIAPFSKRIYPKFYPFCRLIKDHALQSAYLDDKCVLIVRDGRDTVISLAYMTSQQGQHNFVQQGDLADFIRWTEKSYKYGSWGSHAHKLIEASKRPNKHLVRYEELNSNFEAFVKLLDFYDEGHARSMDHLKRIYDNRDNLLDSIKSKPEVNREWGFGHEFERGSLFYEWSKSRGGSSWRKSWDTAAKKAFHETGATDALIELGYETDPAWWRQ